jgi:hypothetical protein
MACAAWLKVTCRTRDSVRRILPLEPAECVRISSFQVVYGLEKLFAGILVSHNLCIINNLRKLHFTGFALYELSQSHVGMHVFFFIQYFFTLALTYSCRLRLEHRGATLFSVAVSVAE